jgi:phage gp16-like protein
VTASRTKVRGTRAARAVELAKIHIGAQALGLRQPGDDSAYRDMLWSIGRVRSAADLDEAGRRRVLDHLRGCGWQDTSPPGRGRYQRGTQAALIRRLWDQLADAGLVRDRSDRALRRFIAQRSGVAQPAPDEIAPQHLDRAQAREVIEQLKRWLARGANTP